MVAQDLTGGDKLKTDDGTKTVIYANDYEVWIEDKGRYPLPFVQAMIDDNEFVVVE